MVTEAPPPIRPRPRSAKIVIEPRKIYADNGPTLVTDARLREKRQAKLEKQRLERIVEPKIRGAVEIHERPITPPYEHFKNLWTNPVSKHWKKEESKGDLSWLHEFISF